jgi:predicted 2-oxoglutarate/Fe(II)-dependent dioxygenase YbiX
MNMAEKGTRPDPDFQALVRTTYSGNPQAMAALGARLLVGREAPLAPVDGAALIEDAAQQGNAQAWTYIAVLAALGIVHEQSWRHALEALGRAAQLGDSKAAQQLQLLRDTGISGEAEAMHWLSSASWKNLRKAPYVASCADFLTVALCAHLVSRASPGLVQAKVYDARRGVLKVDTMRTNTGTAFSLIDTDVVMQLIRARIAHAAGVSVDALEPPEVLHYAVGQRYKPHVDFFHPALPGYAEQMRVKGQRIKTCLVYLNQDYDGGETDFPKIQLKFRGRAGEALMFENVRANGAGDLRTLHEGLPPTRGEKWLLSQWIRNKPQPIA